MVTHELLPNPNEMDKIESDWRDERQSRAIMRSVAASPLGGVASLVNLIDEVISCHIWIVLENLHISRLRRCPIRVEW